MIQKLGPTLLSVGKIKNNPTPPALLFIVHLESLVLSLRFAAFHAPSPPLLSLVGHDPSLSPHSVILESFCPP